MKLSSECDVLFCRCAWPAGSHSIAPTWAGGGPTACCAARGVLALGFVVCEPVCFTQRCRNLPSSTFSFFTPPFCFLLFAFCFLLQLLSPLREEVPDSPAAATAALLEEEQQQRGGMFGRLLTQLFDQAGWQTDPSWHHGGAGALDSPQACCVMCSWQQQHSGCCTFPCRV